MKNLYLPGTNKNVGYLDKDVLYLYERHMKYFPLTMASYIGVGSDIVAPVIFSKRDKKVEENIQLKGHSGFFYNVDTKMWIFSNCTFKTPDNLDVIEMAYLYKNWNKKKHE